MAEVVHFKAFKARSRRRRVEAAACKANLRLPDLHTPSVGRSTSDAAHRNPEAIPSFMGVLNTVVIPLVILLCSIAAFAIFITHLSGQPGYSARNNVSPPTLIE
ncbi:hypothetical protein G6M50_07765 [Agrobacterium rhizogenes]|jgi:hypothetical protein|nr:hypothetical protein [Rhizobium rhizogenes]NTJ77695.1 hypothetical protein [Rhizobium rhizogenes]